uniref:Uncharacterized protein n=1 Tax=Chenopodium quinoa TaxID=63459 RepID=A0A803LU42_CHEQI
MGNFSLFKSVNSDDFSTNQLGGGPPNEGLSTGSVSDFEVRDGSGLRGRPMVWGDLKKNSSILSGILVAARTSMPLTKRAMVNFRWGVSFPSAECGGGVSEAKPQFPIWMGREVEDLKRENREMKQALEGMRGKVPVSRSRGEGREGDVVGKRMMPLPSECDGSSWLQFQSTNSSMAVRCSCYCPWEINLKLSQ